MYYMRLDDASQYMDINKWKKIESLFDKYFIKPIYGIIPNNQDPSLLKYTKVEEFWSLMNKWKEKGWIPALHGYTHVFETMDGGLNPVNKRSEFAGISFERQCRKISAGYKLLKEHDIIPSIFFAPAHTFDKNTLRALEQETQIRVISDTVAYDVYYKDNFYFIPQQSGMCRKLPFKTVTFCYHPNIMEERDFDKLEEFLKQNYLKFDVFSEKILKKREKGVKDNFLETIYFLRRR